MLKPIFSKTHENENLLPCIAMPQGEKTKYDCNKPCVCVFEDPLLKPALAILILAGNNRCVCEIIQEQM